MSTEPEALYGAKFYDDQASGSLRSAEIVLPRLFDVIRPASVVDVGCGVGTWLHAAGTLGITDLLGIDGDYVDRAALQIPAERFLAADLSVPGLADRVQEQRAGRFDLVMSLEVAEHLPFDRSGSFVRDLCELGDLVLFSAAVPFQHGTGHINEQWPEFWAIQFRSQGFACFDILRGAVWAEPDVSWWYAQNLLVFARVGSGAHATLSAASAADRPGLSVVHPEAWLSAVLNHWCLYRAAAREEEPADLKALMQAWTSKAATLPALRAIERARAAAPDARDVFPFTRTERASPEQLLTDAQAVREAMLAQLSTAQARLDDAAKEQARLDDAEKEQARLRAELELMGDLRLELTSLRVGLQKTKADEAMARSELDTAQRRVATLTGANATLRGQVARLEPLQEEVPRRAAELASLRTALSDAEQQVAAMRASTSWRVTRPIRALRRLVSRSRGGA